MQWVGNILYQLLSAILGFPVFEEKNIVPKIRTSRTVVKRFKVSAKGKLIRGCTLQNHRMKKASNQGRRLKREYEVEGTKRRVTIERMVGGHL
jgi:ribosomal protein L35